MNYEPIYSLVRQIPKGKVTTYGRIAACLNLASPRIVGRALHLNPDSGYTPCHRVVASNGRLAPSYAFGGNEAQARRLAAEGLQIEVDRVDLAKYLWEPGLLSPGIV
jgi:methylated-DNA-protein-cysteine methyltransferase-like protein